MHSYDFTTTINLVLNRCGVITNKIRNMVYLYLKASGNLIYHSVHNLANSRMHALLSRLKQTSTLETHGQHTLTNY